VTYRAAIVGAGGIAGLGILGLHDAEEIGRKKFTASHAGGYRATKGMTSISMILGSTVRKIIPIAKNSIGRLLLRRYP